MWGGEGERNWKRAEEKGNWTGNEGISMFVYVFCKRVGLWGDEEIDGGAGGGRRGKEEIIESLNMVVRMTCPRPAQRRKKGRKKKSPSPDQGLRLHYNICQSVIDKHIPFFTCSLVYLLNLPTRLSTHLL